MAGFSNFEQDSRLKDLDKYAKFFVSKCVCAISTSRISNKATSTPTRQPSEKNEWFSLTLPQEPSNSKSQGAASISFRNVTPSVDGSSCSCHCSIDVFVETTSGEKMIVETWCIVLERIDGFGYRANGSAPRQEPFKVYARLGLLLKSVVATARLLPANRLARTQSATSFNLCCRVDSGAGSGPIEHTSLRLRHSIGSVDVEPVGRVSVRVAYCSEAVLTDAAMGASLSASVAELQQPPPKPSKSESYAILCNQAAKPLQKDISVLSFASERAPSAVPVSEIVSPTKISPKVSFPQPIVPAFSVITPDLPLPSLSQSSSSSSLDSLNESQIESPSRNLQTPTTCPSYDMSLADEILSDFALVQSTSFPFADLEEPLATFVSLLGSTEDKVSTKTTFEQRQSFLQFSTQQPVDLSVVVPPPALPNFNDEVQLKSLFSQIETNQSEFDELVARLCDNEKRELSSHAGVSFHLGVDSV